MWLDDIFSEFRWYRAWQGGDWFLCKAYGAFCPYPQKGFWCRRYSDTFFYHVEYEMSA